MDFNDKREKERSRLTQELDKLTSAETAVLQALSILYEPTSRTQLLKCLRKAGINNPADKLFNAKTLNEVILSLRARDLVEIINYNISCNELIAETATRQAINSGLFFKVAHIVENFVKPYIKLRYSRYSLYTNYKQALADFRIAIYLKDEERITEVLEVIQQLFPNELLNQHPYAAVCGNPFEKEWIETLPEELLSDALTKILWNSFIKLAPAEDAFNFLKNYCQTATRDATDLKILFAEQLVLRGCPEKAIEVVRDVETNDARAIEAWLLFLLEDNENALRQYEIASKTSSKNKKEALSVRLPDLFYPLALLKDGSPHRLKQADKHAKASLSQAPPELKPAFEAVEKFIALHKGYNNEELETELLQEQPDAENSLTTLFTILADYWINNEIRENDVLKLEDLSLRATRSNYLLMADEAAEILSLIHPSDMAPPEKTRTGRSFKSMVRLMGRQEPWERSLKALMDLAASRAKGEEEIPTTRLAWFITFNIGECCVQPREQKLKASGGWTRGRLMSLKRLSEEMDDIECLTAKDREICFSLEQRYSSRGNRHYSNTYYEFETSKMLSGLVGHPLLFWADSPTVKVDVVKGEPELVVKNMGDSLRIETIPDNERRDELVLVKESPTRLKLIEFTKEYQRITDILGKGITVPAKAKEQILDVISMLSPIVAIHSDIGCNIEDIDILEADERLRVQLIPFGEGLKLQILVKPFSEGGSYYKPGVGGSTLISEINGRMSQTKRNLHRERKMAQDLIANCSLLNQNENIDEEWTIEEPDACLETLMELNKFSEDVIVEWPVGQKLMISHNASLNNLRLNIRRERDWFSLAGELKIDQNLTLEMRELLELARKSPSRFIPLGEGQFLALTESFRKRLDDIAAFTHLQGGETRFHPLAALAMEDIFNEVGASEVDKTWESQLEIIKNIKEQKFEPPSTLQAELREYQLEGFNWMIRLATMGVGACLADDMGLGKTIQAISVILSRAGEGPSLVVAPTSVCMNWLEETQKFAPSLNTISFHDLNREDIVNNLAPFDLVVCSYGLLQQQTKLLEDVTWQTIVLDEAQAIKNISTKRSKAAMALNGNFKLITTGTPIENHLGELWNLFRFINRDLLGALTEFNERFAGPIERDNDKEARERLKRLIQPYVLRRTKDQVLKELPPRTDIVLKVEMGEEENALYNALRRDALDKMDAGSLHAEKNRFKILAEIMKLRRACCNPQLVLPETTAKSGKLEVFGEILEELLDNNHKALVFSQFVDHLKIIREYLDKKGISYQYLDGSTPAKQRQSNVEAFQSGEGDVFLISLKAGGLGLNLTAADYVIHMDPWWNPAVEDQASDRAHRIGQYRPVTIYRLIMKNSIEEKIIKLHNQKRELADSLLDGSDASGKISADELLNLLIEP